MTTPRAAAFFDLDKTIIAKSSVLAFGRPFYREGLLSRRAIVRSAYAQVVFMMVGADEAKMEKLRKAMLDMVRGWNQHEVAQIVRETLDEVVTPIIFSEALDLIEQHQAQGLSAVIVSSAPEEVVKPLGEFLGVDDVIATRCDVDATGDYTGELAFYGYGPNKADAIRALASREGFDLAAVVRVQRLDHRRADAARGRPPGRGEPRPGARPRSPRTRAGRSCGSSVRCASAAACPSRHDPPSR